MYLRMTRHPLKRDHLRGRGTRRQRRGRWADGGDDGGDYYDREGPARVSSTTTSASLRTLLPASLADLRVTAYSPDADILWNGIILDSESQRERNEAAARAMAVTTAATTTRRPASR